MTIEEQFIMSALCDEMESLLKTGCATGDEHETIALAREMVASNTIKAHEDGKQ